MTTPAAPERMAVRCVAEDCPYVAIDTGANCWRHRHPDKGPERMPTGWDVRWFEGMTVAQANALGADAAVAASPWLRAPT